MFTGIIEGLGTVVGVTPGRQGQALTIAADFDLAGTKLGDSIAVDGACLTAVRLDERRFTVDVSPETLKRTTLGDLRIGARVNLERALRLGDRLDGHLVSGHVDGIGRIKDRRQEGNAIVIGIGVPTELSHYMIEKGSVAVAGTSLTINRVSSAGFEVSIIPHTAHLTTIGTSRVGQRVNIETDMIGKYVEKFVSEGRGSRRTSSEDATSGGLDLNFLNKTGFL
ncbi:MAG: riboflavin synthase [Desulfosarcinaceae bacterium]|jgi:riboflavin synthase